MIMEWEMETDLLLAKKMLRGFFLIFLMSHKIQRDAKVGEVFMLIITLKVIQSQSI
jgi:hypothetical protein